MTPPLWQKWKGTKEPLDEAERNENEQLYTDRLKISSILYEVPERSR